MTMAKMTKDEISTELNEMLDTDIPWKKLPKDALVELKKMFENPEIMLKNILRYQKQQFHYLKMKTLIFSVMLLKPWQQIHQLKLLYLFS